MRGRLDASEGFPRPLTPAMSTNLLQEPEFGIGLSNLFHIQERAPAPTLGSEIVPVVVVDTLHGSAWPPHSRVIGAKAQLGDGVSRAWIGMNCRGKPPSGNPQDRLVIHRVVVWHSAFALIGLEVGRDPSVAGLGGSFALQCNTGRDAPGSGVRRSDFTGMLAGLSGDAPDANAQQLHAGVNPTVIEGPFILNQLEAVFVYQNTASANTLSALFLADEFPAP